MTEESAKEVEQAYFDLLRQAIEISTNFNLKYGQGVDKTT